MLLKVKLGDIIEVLEEATDEARFYLDRETGQVHLLTDEMFSLAEHKNTVLETLPEWEREPVKLARQIKKDDERGTRLRYLALPDQFEIHEWALMEQFTRTLEDPVAGKQLQRSIHGAGAFRRFKILLDEFNLWDAWNRFRQAELREIAIDWCEEHGIEWGEN